MDHFTFEVKVFRFSFLKATLVCWKMSAFIWVPTGLKVWQHPCFQQPIVAEALWPVHTVRVKSAVCVCVFNNVTCHYHLTESRLCALLASLRAHHIREQTACYSASAANLWHDTWTLRTTVWTCMCVYVNVAFVIIAWVQKAWNVCTHDNFNGPFTGLLCQTAELGQNSICQICFMCSVSQYFMQNYESWFNCVCKLFRKRELRMHNQRCFSK